MRVEDWGDEAGKILFGPGGIIEERRGEEVRDEEDVPPSPSTSMPTHFAWTTLFYLFTTKLVYLCLGFRSLSGTLMI